MVGGQQSTRSLPHFAELFRLADAAGLIEQPELAVRAHEDPAGAARRRAMSRMRDFSQDHRWLSINTATVRKQRGVDWPLLDILDACAARGIRAVSPWRDQVAAAGLQATAQRLQEPRPGTVGLLPRRHVHLHRRRRPAGRARRQPARARRSLHAERALPGAGGRRPARRAGRQGGAPGTSPARARRSREGIAALLEDARERRMPLAIEPLHPMYAADRACINTLEQALDVCDALDPGAQSARCSAWRWTSTTCGGTRSCRRRSSAPASERLLAFHVCDWLTPTTDLLERPRHDGRRRDRHPAHPRLGRGAGLRRLQRGRDLLQRATGGSATAARCWTPASSGTAAASDARSGRRCRRSTVRRTRRTLNALTISTPCSSASAEPDAAAGAVVHQRAEDQRHDAPGRCPAPNRRRRRRGRWRCPAPSA